MENTFKLEIITPEKKYFSDNVERITLSSTNGEITILANHIDMIINVDICPLRIRRNSHELYYAISGGNLIFNQKENKAILLVNAIESKDEIDIERAKKAKENAELKLSDTKDERELYRAEVKLKRSLNRLKVKDIVSY